MLNDARLVMFYKLLTGALVRTTNLLEMAHDLRSVVVGSENILGTLSQLRHFTGNFLAFKVVKFSVVI